MEKFKFLKHTADIKFRAFGKTPEEVFQNSALALFKTLYDKRIKTKKKFKIKTKGKDLENLMYNFLEEFLFLFDSKNFLPSRIINLKLNEKKFEIKAEISGDDIKNYSSSIHVKAITYSEMKIKKEKGIWISQVVLDV